MQAAASRDHYAEYHEAPLAPHHPIHPSSLLELIGSQDGPRHITLLDPSEALAPSRMLLLMAYDACHRAYHKAHGSCPLEVAWPRPLNKEARITATVDLYRALSGDLRASDAALASEADCIAKRRDNAKTTPSAPFRRYLRDPPCSAWSPPGAAAAGYEKPIGYAPAQPPERTYENRDPWAWGLREYHEGEGAGYDAQWREPRPSPATVARPPRSRTPPPPRSPSMTSPPASQRYAHESPSQGSYRAPPPQEYAPPHAYYADILSGGHSGRGSRCGGGSGASVASSPASPTTSPTSADGATPRAPASKLHAHVRSSASRGAERRVGGVALDRVLSTFHRLSHNGGLRYRDVWGALHHCGVSLTSSGASKIVHSYAEGPPDGRLNELEFIALLQHVQRANRDELRGGEPPRTIDVSVTPWLVEKYYADARDAAAGGTAPDPTSDDRWVEDSVAARAVAWERAHARAQVSPPREEASATTYLEAAYSRVEATRRAAAAGETATALLDPSGVEPALAAAPTSPLAPAPERPSPPAASGHAPSSMDAPPQTPRPAEWLSPPTAPRPSSNVHGKASPPSSARSPRSPRPPTMDVAHPSCPPLLLKFLQALCGHTRKEDPHSRSMRDALWRDFDANGNGKVSLAECNAGVMSTLTACWKRDATAIFKRYYRAYIRAFEAAKVASPARPDTDDDDYVTKAEFRLLLHYLGRYATWQEVFLQIDERGAADGTAGDHRISRDEWRAALRKIREAGTTWAASKALARATASDFDGIDPNAASFVGLYEFCQWCHQAEEREAGGAP